MPAYGHTMPHMSRFCKQVFRVLKHIWGGDLERVIRMIVVQSTLIRVWEPDFLQEDNFWLGVAEEMREIMLVPLEAFKIEGEH